MYMQGKAEAVQIGKLFLSCMVFYCRRSCKSFCQVSCVLVDEKEVFCLLLAPVFQRVHRTVHKINHYPRENSIGFGSTYPMDLVIYPMDSAGTWTILNCTFNAHATV